MTIKEFKQWWNRFEYSGNFPEPKAEHINLLLAEVDRLRADRQLEADIDLPPGVITLMRENEGLKAALAKKDAEIERLDRVFHNQGNLREQIFDLQFEITRLNGLIGDTRLADQEAIERHTRRVVAGECAEIAEAMWSDHYWAWPAMQTYAAEIRKKYGVE